MKMNEIKKWKRSLGTSKRGQGVVTPKSMQIGHSMYDLLYGRQMIARLVARAWDTLPERVKEKCFYYQKTKEEKAEARLFGFNPYE